MPSWSSLVAQRVKDPVLSLLCRGFGSLAWELLHARTTVGKKKKKKKKSPLKLVQSEFVEESGAPQ